MILVIAEQRGGKLNRATWETIAAAQQLAAGQPITIAVPAADASVRSGVAAELAAADVDEVVTLEHAALEPYTPDGYTAALEQAIGSLAPTLVLLPHTYQTRDFAPKLAARMDRALITDVTAIKTSGQTAFVRPMFQGKLTADVVPLGPAPHLITFQIGAFRADQAAKGASAAAVRPLAVTLEAPAIRQKPDPPFQEAKQAVAGAADCRRWPGHQGPRTSAARAPARRCARRRARRVASDLRFRLAPDGAAGRQLRPDRRAEALSGARHLRRDSASGRHEGVEHDRRHQQGS
jgi:electron transfer flavoprotein alpha subunit